MAPQDVIARLAKLSASTSGADKQLMLVQYAGKLISLSLSTPRFQSLLDPKTCLSLALSLSRLSSLVSDNRTLLRFLGLFPIAQWYGESNAVLKKGGQGTLDLVEQLQILSMFIYFPLEHVYYLASHKILTGIKASTLNRISLLSCRSWAVYVFLDLYRLYKENHLTRSRINTIESSPMSTKEHGLQAKNEIIALRKKVESYKNEAIVNLCYAPLTLHWSLPNGLYRNEMLTNIFGTLAALYQLKAKW